MAHAPKLGFNTQQHMVAAEDAAAGETLAALPAQLALSWSASAPGPGGCVILPPASRAHYQWQPLPPLCRYTIDPRADRASVLGDQLTRTSSLAALCARRPQ